MTFEEFESMLKYYDWYYLFSDDHRCYSAGRASWEKISNAMAELKSIDYGLTKELYEKYCPWKEELDADWLDSVK